MKHNTFLSRTLATMALVGLTIASINAQTLKNRGVIRNVGTATYNTVENFRTGTGGTILNSGTMTVNTSLDNDDAATGQGTVRNYIGGVAAGTLTVGTNLENGGGAFYNDSTTYAPRFRVGGAINSSGTFDTDGGVVEYNGGAGQSVFTTAYGALVANNAGAKTLGGDVTVNDSVRVAGSSSLAVGGNTLTVNAATFTLQGTGSLSAASGTVDYARNGDQDVVATTYGNLTLSGSSAAHTKTATGNVTLSASGALTVGANDTLFVTGNLDLSGVGVTLANNEAVKMGGDATFVGTITNAGTFYYAGTATQTIGSVTYDDLRLGGSGAKNFPNATVGILGDYTIDGGTGARDYTSAGSSATLAFQGTSGGQTVSNLSGESLNILEFSGAATKSLGGTALAANRLSILGTSGAVTNNIAGTFAIANISGISMTVASGRDFTNSAASTITMTGDLENDGTIVNLGTITVQ